MNRKTVFFDLDGTMLGARDGKMFCIPEDALQAVADLKHNGHFAVACTGRPAKFVRHFFPGVFDGIIASNGAHVVVGEKILRDWVLPEERVRALLERFDAFGCRYFFVGSDHAWARNLDDMPPAVIEKFRRTYFFPDFIVTRWEPGEIAANAMDFLFRSEEEFEAQRHAFLGEGMVFSRHSSGLSGDLSLSGNDKGFGVRCFLSHTGTAREDTAAFGDGRGDLAMMREAGFSIAMGNASDEVKRAADYVTASLFEGGVPQGLRRLGLI